MDDILGDWMLTKNATLHGKYNGVSLVIGNVISCLEVFDDGFVTIEYSPCRSGVFFNNLKSIAEKLD